MLDNHPRKMYAGSKLKSYLPPLNAKNEDESPLLS